MLLRVGAASDEELIRRISAPPAQHDARAQHAQQLNSRKCQCCPDDMHHDFLELLHNESLTPLSIEVGGLGQAAVTAAGSLPAAAQRDAMVFGFFEPVGIFPV